MSFCNLANDIFISYAHADNTEAWVDKFHERLFHKLKQLDRKAEFAIWRDGKLAGADVFSDEIDRQLKSSGILISILSPNGLDSSWCLKERQCFERATAKTGGLRIGTKSRAIRVTKTPCAEDKDRNIFGTLGYEFYRRSEQAGRFAEIHPSSPEFDAFVLDMAQEVFDLLKELRPRLLAPPPDIAIYVASVSSDLEPWRSRLVDQLSGWNCRVISQSESVTQLSTELIHSALDGCALSLHLIGPRRGLVPEGDENLPIDLLQLTCARSAQIDRIVCHVGQPHPGWQELSKPESSGGSEDLVRHVTPDDLLQFLEDRIGALRKTATRQSSDLPIVYVVCNEADWNDALRLKKCLETEQNCAAILPIRDVDDASIRLRDHHATLKTCEAVLVYWGATSPPSWFREQQREVIGARKKRRAKLLPALCLSSSPHADPAADTLPGLPLQLISDIDCSNVRRFFRHLEIGTNGGLR
jgi:hypothetical protein